VLRYNHSWLPQGHLCVWILDPHNLADYSPIKSSNQINQSISLQFNYLSINDDFKILVYKNLPSFLQFSTNFSNFSANNLTSERSDLVMILSRHQLLNRTLTFHFDIITIVLLGNNSQSQIYDDFEIVVTSELLGGVSVNIPANYIEAFKDTCNGRYFHTAIVNNNSLYLFGGIDLSGQICIGLTIIDVSTVTRATEGGVRNLGSPGGRYLHTAVLKEVTQ